MKALYTITGNVSHGKGRGKRLGFPTINMQLTQPIPEGVYISQVEFNGKWHRSITFIGAARTFGEEIVQMETTLFEFDQQIYGESITVALFKKIRGNKKFITETMLIAQMEVDKKHAL